MIINLSKIDFGGVAKSGGGNAKPEEVFDVQPTTSDQTITPTEGSVFSGGTVRAVTSDIDNNIVPENIKEGVSILGVAGTLSSGGGSDVFMVPPEMRLGCSKFTEVPSNWDFSNVTDMSGMFYMCSYLTSIPQLDTSKVTNMSNMFYFCTGLTSIPLLDTSNVTDMNNMFYYTNLTSIPLLDTSKVTNMSNMFNCCFGLTTIPQLDTSNVTDMSYIFQQSSIKIIPQLDTSKVTNMSCMFNYASPTTVEGIDFSGLTSDLTDLCGYESEMPSLTRFIVNGKINVSMGEYSIKPLTKIDYDSVKSILAAADRTDNTNAKTLAFNRTMTDQNGELAALVASCTSKGWTITGLTLQ